LTLSVRSFQTPETPLDLRLTTQLPLGADLARDAGYFGGEDSELVNHPIYQFGRMQKLASQPATAHFKSHHLPQIALCHSADCAGDLCGGPRKIVHECVESFDFVGPASNETAGCHALSQATLLSNHPGNMRGFPCAALTHRHDFIEGIGNFPFYPCPSNRQTGGKVAVAEGQHRLLQVHLKRSAIAVVGAAGIPPRCEPGSALGRRPGRGDRGFAHG
jgi:hypothetical protein